MIFHVSVLPRFFDLNWNKKPVFHMKTLSLFILLLLFTSSASAVALKNLYDVAVTVNSQAGSERNRAIEEAFKQLLIKVTGQPDIVEQESGIQLISDAKKFVRSFRYTTVDEKVLPPLIIPWPVLGDEEKPVLDLAQQNIEEEEAITKQELVVSFDEKAVGDALWKAKLPVWGKTRPSVLLWVAFQDSEKRMLLDAKQESELQRAMNKQAKKRGVPLLYPKIDRRDQASINITDVWGGYKEPLVAASTRYSTDEVVTVQLKLDRENNWQARWNLYHADEVEFWRSSAADIQQILAAGIDEIAQRVAKRYVSISIADDGDTLIYISDVNNVFDYNRVSKYLNGLTSVKKAELAQVSANEAVFRLDLRSGTKQLKQAIALGKTLASVDSFGMDKQDARISYRLNQ